MVQSQIRRRKVAILSQEGFQKLEVAKSKTEIWNHQTKSCTLETLSEKTGISTHTLSKIHTRKRAVDLQTLLRYFRAFNLDLETRDYIPPTENTNKINSVKGTSYFCKNSIAESLSEGNSVSWGVAPDVSVFYGRTTELQILQEWVLKQHCRLISLVGMGGIGKTFLATKFAEKMQYKFKYVVWRSLRPITRSHSPISLSNILDDLIRHLTPHSNLVIPEMVDTKIRQLMNILRHTSCLLVLDNVEFILQGKTLQTFSSKTPKEQHYADDDGYGEFLRQLGQGQHQSCIVLTSRVEPKAIQPFLGNTPAFRSLSIEGLQVGEIQQMLSSKGKFQGSAVEWNRLVNYYGRNPLILGTVATTIQCLFDSSITDFLNQNNLIFDDVSELIQQHLGDLSVPAQEAIEVLANHNKPISLSELKLQVSRSNSDQILLGTLQSLKARSLIDIRGSNFSLQPLVKLVYKEIANKM